MIGALLAASLIAAVAWWATGYRLLGLTAGFAALCVVVAPEAWLLIAGALVHAFGEWFAAEDANAGPPPS